MKEILFALYLLSGLIKAVFLLYEFDSVVDITALLAALLLIIIGIEIFQRDLFQKIFTKKRLLYCLPLAAFYIWLLISLSFSPSESYSYKKAFLFLTNIIAFFIPMLSLNFKLTRFRNVFIISTILLGLVFILGYPDYPLQTISILGIENFRIFGTYYLSVAFYLGISTLFAIQIKDYRIRLLVMSLLFLLLVGTAGRGPILFTVILLLAYGVLQWKRMWTAFRIVPRRAFTFLVFLIVLNSIAYYGATHIQRFAVDYHRTAFRFGIMMKDPKLMDMSKQGLSEEDDPAKLSKQELKAREQTMQNASIVKRKEHYIYAIDAIFDNLTNLVFGHGCGSYGILKEGADKRLYPHNLYLEIWFELGLIGLIIFIGFTLQVLYRMFGAPVFLNLIVIYILLNFQKSLSLTDMRVFFGFCSLILFLPLLKPVHLPKFLRRS